MQQSPVNKDLPSSYFLWQFFMTPAATEEYAFLPTVLHASHLGTPPGSYIQEQCITNTYHLRQQYQRFYSQQQKRQQDYAITNSHFQHKILTDKSIKHGHKQYKKLDNVQSNNNGHLTIDSENRMPGGTAVQSKHTCHRNRLSFSIDAILHQDDTPELLHVSEKLLTGAAVEGSTLFTTSSAAEPVSPSNEQFGMAPALVVDTPVQKCASPFMEVASPRFYPYSHSNLAHFSLQTPSSSSFSSLSSSSSSNSTSPESAEKSAKRSGRKCKRMRTIFTPEQLDRLETEFERQQYMVGTERFYLATSLNLTEAQVKVWFQNRRIKWRKQHLEKQQTLLAQGNLYKDLAISEDSDDPEGSDMSNIVQSQDKDQRNHIASPNVL